MGILEKLRELSGTSGWIELHHDDVSKLSTNVHRIFLNAQEDKLQILWQAPNGLWKTNAQLDASLKKVIMRSLRSVSYRGTVSPGEFLEVAQDAVTHRLFTISLGDEQATRNVSDQLSKVPESPNAQSIINNLHLPRVLRPATSENDPSGKIPPGQSPGD